MNDEDDVIDLNNHMHEKMESIMRFKRLAVLTNQNSASICGFEVRIRFISIKVWVRFKN